MGRYSLASLWRLLFVSNTINLRLKSETSGRSSRFSKDTPLLVRVQAKWQLRPSTSTAAQAVWRVLTSGTFLTFAQFVFVAVQTFNSQLVWTKGSWVPAWRKNQVPLKRWMVQVVLFFAVSLSA